VPQNFLYPQRDRPLLLPVDMREWLPEDDLVYVVLDAVATLDLGGFRRRYRGDGHGRAAFDPEMMVALLLYGYGQGERSSRVIEKRCVRDVAYRVVTGGLHPGHATIARFRARHETALGGLFSQVLRLLATEGMVSVGLLGLDGTKLARNASQKASKTLPQIEKLLAEAAAADAAGDAEHDGNSQPVTPQALARRAGRRERLAVARDRLAAEDQGRRDAQRAKQEAWAAAAAAGKRRGHRPADEPPRPNRNNTEPRANTTDPDVRVMRDQKGYVAGYNGQLVVTAGQVIVGAMLAQHPVGRTLLHPLLDTCRPAAGPGRDQTAAADRARRLRLRHRGQLRPRRTAPPTAAGAAGQGPGGPPHPRSSAAQAPRPAPGHRARRPADAPPPRPCRLQTPRPDRRASVRPDQNLHEDDRHVPPRTRGLHQRMATGRHRPQPAQVAHPASKRITPARATGAGTPDTNANRLVQPPTWNHRATRLCATG
jgi:transposase